jgi:hypothetical protein
VKSIFPEFNLSVPMPEGGWHHLDDAPKDGTPIVVLTTHTFRWAPYVDEGKAKLSEGKLAQRVNGILGRWQTLDIRGQWVNCQPPIGVWRP